MNIYEKILCLEFVSNYKFKILCLEFVSNYKFTINHECSINPKQNKQFSINSKQNSEITLKLMKKFQVSQNNFDEISKTSMI